MPRVLALGRLASPDQGLGCPVGILQLLGRGLHPAGIRPLPLPSCPIVFPQKQGVGQPWSLGPLALIPFPDVEPVTMMPPRPCAQGATGFLCPGNGDWSLTLYSEEETEVQRGEPRAQGHTWGWCRAPPPPDRGPLLAAQKGLCLGTRTGVGQATVVGVGVWGHRLGQHRPTELLMMLEGPPSLLSTATATTSPDPSPGNRLSNFTDFQLN